MAMWTREFNQSVPKISAFKVLRIYLEQRYAGCLVISGFNIELTNFQYQVVTRKIIFNGYAGCSVCSDLVEAIKIIPMTLVLPISGLVIICVCIS